MIIRRTGGRVQVITQPDHAQLAGSIIPIAITAREVRNQRFQSTAQLHQALRDARTVTLRGDVT